MIIKTYSCIFSMIWCVLFIGLSILDINNSITLSLFIAFFDILPVFGIEMILFPWMLYQFMIKQYIIVFGLLIMYIIIVVLKNLIEIKFYRQDMSIPLVYMLVMMFILLKLTGIYALFILPFCMVIIKEISLKRVDNGM